MILVMSNPLQGDVLGTDPIRRPFPIPNENRGNPRLRGVYKGGQITLQWGAAPDFHAIARIGYFPALQLAEAYLRVKLSAMKPSTISPQLTQNGYQSEE